MRCKFVCKSWSDLIVGGDFSASYIPKPCLAFKHKDTGYVVYDEGCEPLFRFRLAQSAFTHKNLGYDLIGSVNGLVLVWDNDHCCDHILCLVNPMTNEYIKLSPLPVHRHMFGFGVSKLSGQYKILLGDQWRPHHIYTVGREGSWRSIEAKIATPRLPYDADTKSLNGNLHWLASGSDLICCFDLETELFTTFSRPPRDHHGYGGLGDRKYGLCILEGFLCLCVSSDDFRVVVWRMNNYGDANSWVKEYTFNQKPYIAALPYIVNTVLPLRVLKNGDLLFTTNTDVGLFVYSKNMKAVEKFGDLQRSTDCYYSNNLQRAADCYYSYITIYTPTFFSLKSIGIQNVQSLIFY